MFFGIGELLVMGIIVVFLLIIGRDGRRNIGETLNDNLRAAGSILPVFSAAETDGREAEFIDDKPYDGRRVCRFILFVLLFGTLLSLFVSVRFCVI